MSVRRRREEQGQQDQRGTAGIVKPYYEDDAVTIYHGDALEVLAELEISVDAVITDPPYSSGSRTEASKVSSGAMLRSTTDRANRTRFGDRPIDLDQMTTTGFVWLMRATALDCYDLLPDGGRQWSNLCGALETCNLRVQGMIVWDKGSMGLGNGFRARHELACHTSKGVPNVYDKGTGNVIECPVDADLERLVLDRVLRHKRVPPTDHPSPKPEPLMLDIIDVVTPAGGLILDPFMGGGSTLRAAKVSGRRAIGIERSEAYCEIAAERCGGPIRNGVDTLFGGAV